MTTLGARLDQTKGIGLGFDLLRVLLAVSVVLAHSAAIIPHHFAPGDLPFVWMPHFAILSMFFALSGFLISGSALRLNLSNFLVNRGLRILPALVVEIVLSALVLGPIFTTLSLSNYFRSPALYHYFTNLFGLVNYYLPGVFIKNPDIRVNISLRTVPAELLCYCIMSACILCGVLKKPLVTIALAIVISLIGFYLLRLGFSRDTPGLLGRLFRNFWIGDTTRTIVAFLFGIFIYQLRYIVPYSWYLVTACLVMLAILSLIPPHSISDPVIGILVGPLLAYLTVFLGATDLPTPKLLHRGDYSYGIYLYGFPIQQAVSTLTPGITSMWLEFMISLPLIFVFAMFSWHFIEKPILAQRRRFSFVAKMRGVDHAPAPEALTSKTFPVIADAVAP